jgi:hypothetical protein
MASLPVERSRRGTVEAEAKIRPALARNQEKTGIDYARKSRAHARMQDDLRQAG